MMTRRWFWKVLAACGLGAILPRVGHAQLSDAAKLEFANMELTGYQALGIDSHIIERLLHWNSLGNTASARTIATELYMIHTGRSTLTLRDRHEFLHWLDSHSKGTGRVLSTR